MIFECSDLELIYFANNLFIVRWLFSVVFELFGLLPSVKLSFVASGTSWSGIISSLRNKKKRNAFIRGNESRIEGLLCYFVAGFVVQDVVDHLQVEAVGVEVHSSSPVLVVTGLLSFFI